MKRESQLLQQVRVIDPIHQTDQVADVWLMGDNIQGIEAHFETIPAETTVIDGQGLVFAPGLVDLYSYSGEPGHEERETFQTLGASAIAGGFSQVAILPTMQPSLDNPSTLTLIQQKLAHLDPKQTPKFYFWGNLTLRGNGVMREGTASIRFGLSGDPVMSESSAIASILEMVSTTQTPVHLMRISTARGVELIAEAKSRNLPITASVSWMHLLLNTEKIGSYNPNFHLNPPLGNESDRLALIQAIKTGSIDAIAVDHRAYTYEEKTLAFAESPSGSIGLELALPCLWQHLVETGYLTALELWQALRVNPLKCLGLAATHQDFLLFEPAALWTVDGLSLKTLGRNTPWLGESIQGKVTRMIRG